MLNDLLRRTATGIVLLAIVIAALWFDRLALPFLLIFVAVLAAREYCRLWQPQGIHVDEVILFMPAVLVPLLVYFQIPLFFPLLLVFFGIAFSVVMRYPGRPVTARFIGEAAALVFGVVYLTLLPATLLPLRRLGFFVCLFPMVLTWIFDTFAYLVGSLAGRRKLIPWISPKKSVEGTLAAFLLTFPCTWFIARYWVASLDLLDCVVVTLGIGLLGTLGDLFESGMKRAAGVKDTGNLFPGHGGVLDRIDSLVFNVPFFFLYLTYYG